MRRAIAPSSCRLPIRRRFERTLMPRVAAAITRVADALLLFRR